MVSLAAVNVELLLYEDIILAISDLGVGLLISTSTSQHTLSSGCYSSPNQPRSFDAMLERGILTTSPDNGSTTITASSICRAVFSAVEDC